MASDDISTPVTCENAKFVVKIEPHKSGPLFVEIHCLIKAGKPTGKSNSDAFVCFFFLFDFWLICGDNNNSNCVIYFDVFAVERPLPLGMPTYMASGGHYFGQSRYRFLILPRYDFDLHSIIRNRQVDTKNILIIATQLLDILEHIHDCGYAHSDIKAENIMIGKCSYKKGGAKPDAKLSASNKQGGGGGKGGGATAAAAATVSAADKRKINRRLRMTLVNNDSGTAATTTASSEVHRPSSKRTAKSKSYAESNSSFSSNKSDDSDFSEDFDKLSDEDDDEEDDEDEELDDDDDDSNNEEDENDSGM